MFVLVHLWHALLIYHSLVGPTSTAQAAQRPLKQETSGHAYLDESFDSFVKEILSSWDVPGCSIAVIDGDKVYSKGYGYASLPYTKATPDTQYFTGSTTKAFTAAAIAQLVHNQSHYPDVKWDSPIANFLRQDFVLEDEHATTHMTIEDALSHRSGIPRHDLSYGQTGDTPSSLVRRLRHLPATAEPRTLWQYNNIMYAVMTNLLETVTGLKLETILHDRFWAPLGMTSTAFSLSSPAISESRLARGYFWDSKNKRDTSIGGKGRYIAEPYVDLLPLSGAGATISTVNDYALWIKALLSATPLENKPANASSPVTPAMILDLWKPRSLVFQDLVDQGWDTLATPPTYALGWINVKAGGEPIITHTGGLTGFGTNVYLVPRWGFGLALMGNTRVTSNYAQAIIASDLLKRRKARETLIGAADADLTAWREPLLAVAEMELPRSFSFASIRECLSGRRGDTTHASSLDKSTARTASLPLPGSIQDYAGLYTHPGYGLVNFSVTSLTLQGRKEEEDSFLEAFVAPRTWPYRLRLRHITDTVFEVEAATPHGIADIRSEDIVWEAEVLDRARRAVFKFGLDGETVETMGIEAEAEMVKMARAKGEKAWKEGMIWFERV